MKKIIFLSEDATRITQRVERDPRTNQMVGLVLPIDQHTGMPKSLSYLARNCKEIESNMRKPQSDSVYVVMAQPLALNVPPFVLQLFGSNNTFKTSDVLRRWEHTVNELKRLF